MDDMTDNFSSKRGIIFLIKLMGMSPRQLERIISVRSAVVLFNIHRRQTRVDISLNISLAKPRRAFFFANGNHRRRRNLCHDRQVTT